MYIFKTFKASIFFFNYDSRKRKSLYINACVFIQTNLQTQLDPQDKCLKKCLSFTGIARYKFVDLPHQHLPNT